MTEGAASSHEIRRTNTELRAGSGQRGRRSLFGRGSVSLPNEVTAHLLNDLESEITAEAGDDGGRSLHGSSRRESVLKQLELERFNSLRRYGSVNDETSRLEEDCENERTAEAGDDGGRHSRHASGSRRERDLELGAFRLGSMPNDALIYAPYFPQGLGDLTETKSPVSPLPEDLITPPLSEHPLLHTDKPPPPPTHQVKQEECPQILEYLSILAHLAIFGIIGVLIRYGLQVLFGPDVANVMNGHSALYLDLPSNMVGSFFMGWVGVVFKGKISLFSNALAIGLSTGLMGSITTFTAWIQSMIHLTTKQEWVMGVIGLLLGMELAQMSLALGIESAMLIKYVHSHIRQKRQNIIWIPFGAYYQHHVYGFIMCIIVIGILWGGALLLSIFDFRSHHKTKLWLACLVGPFGVWIRWYLARLNGQGIGNGPKKHLKWLPVGTLLTNLIATMLMATLSTIHLVVKGNDAKMIIESFQLGFLGCFSTVSTFVVEVRAMHQSNHTWRAYAYVCISIFPAFILGSLIYSIPVWVKGYST